MLVTVVQVHPLPESFGTAVLAAATSTLAADGHDLSVHRLQDGADPGLDDLAGTDALVLVYPTWWGGHPAAMLDWLQRLLGPWIDGDAAEPSPLATVGHLVTVTTHGSSRLINRVQGEPGRRLFERVLPGLCTPGVEQRWISLYDIDRSSEADRLAFLDRVQRELRLVSPAPQAAAND